MRRRFIVIEGIDGSGKSTQCRYIEGRLHRKGVDTLLTVEPTYSPIGSVLREELIQNTISEWTALYMFAADRTSHLETVVQPALEAGKTIICDRYILSTLGYQATSSKPGAPSLQDAWVIHSRFRAPDLTIVIDVNIDTALERIAARNGVPVNRYENRERLTQIQKGYYAAMGFLTSQGHEIAVVDGTGTQAEVTERVMQILELSA